MHNFMSYDRRWLDAPHSGDHLGRAAWALGEVIAAKPGPALLVPSVTCCASCCRRSRSCAGRARWPSPRSAWRAPATSSSARRRTESCARSRSGWRDLQRGERHAGLVLARGRPDLRQRPAAAGADRGGRPPGRRRTGARGHARAVVVRRASWTSTASSCGWSATVAAGAATPRHGHRRRAAARRRRAGRGRGRGLRSSPATTRARRDAVRAFEWFLGRNRLAGAPSTTSPPAAVTTASGRQAVNANEGAESTLAYLQALLALDAAGLQATLSG